MAMEAVTIPIPLRRKSGVIRSTAKNLRQAEFCWWPLALLALLAITDLIVYGGLYLLAKWVIKVVANG